MSLKLMGTKKGMMQVFAEDGTVVVCTVIEAEPNVVAQIKNAESDGYAALQLAYKKYPENEEKRRKARCSKAQRGHFAKNSVEPRRHLSESRIDDTSSYEVGQEITVEYFAEMAYVDVTARSKGKGFQGVMKKFNFSGGPASHGSGFHRHAGSTGMRSTPGRCLPGGPRPSQMGDKFVTTQGLKVVEVIPEENLLILKGAVPGANGALVYVSEAVKRPGVKKSSGVKLCQR